MKDLIEQNKRYDFEAHGFPCHIMAHLGSHCGYVKVDRLHPLFKETYMESEKIHLNLTVHGGVTYTEMEDNLWSIGWDGLHGRMDHWDRHDAIEETIKLAEQIKNKFGNFSKEIK